MDLLCCDWALKQLLELFSGDFVSTLHTWLQWMKDELLSLAVNYWKHSDALAKKKNRCQFVPLNGKKTLHCSLKAIECVEVEHWLSCIHLELIYQLYNVYRLGFLAKPCTSDTVVSLILTIFYC